MKRVCFAHIAVHQPSQVTRDPYGTVKMKGAKADSHQVLAFRRGRRFGVVSVFINGNISFNISRPASACAIRGSVYWVAASGGGVGACDSHIRSDRNCGSAATNWLRAVVPVRGNPMTKTGPSTTSSSISGWLGIGVDDLQALDKSIADRGVLDDLAHPVELGFGVQRVDGPFETFPVIGRSEVVETCRGARSVFEFVGRECHTANLSCTARRRRSRTDARSSAVTLLVSAGNADAMSSKDTTRALGVGAVFGAHATKDHCAVAMAGGVEPVRHSGIAPHSTTRTKPSESTAA